MARACAWLVACAAAMGMGFAAAAQDQATASAPSPGASDDPRIDPATGRDKRVWPTDPVFDFLSLRLDMDVPTMSEPKFTARETLLFEAVGNPRDSITLDAGPGLTFTAATVEGKAARFERGSGSVTVFFEGSARPGHPVTMTLDYNADKPGGNGAGLTWSKDSKETPEEDAMFHSQGEPESNRLWFPCHDFPNERLSTEICVTVPEGYQAVSNGRLLSVTKIPGADGKEGGGVRTRYHWLQAQPHASYLVTLVISKFDVVDLGGPESAYPGLWMPVYGPLGSGEALRALYANTPEMIKYYEGLLDEKYPWDKYAQVVARDFHFGAMENTSATTLAPQFASGRPGSADSVICHELFHQWTGDLVTTRGWEHLWLNEGWASMAEAMWAEHKRGPEGYQRAMLGFVGRERGTSADTYAPRSSALVSHRYTDPDSRFYAPNNVYSKGACVLHMLRQRLGDEVFWKGVRLYIDRNRFTCAETDDFRNALEDASGQSLERFFQQWCYRPGVPHLAVDYDYDDVHQKLTVVVEQTQKVDADNPAYALSIPIYLEWKEQKETNTPASNKYVYLDTNVKRIEATFTMDRKPDQIILDPFVSNLAIVDTRKPLAMWIDQLDHGPTLFARSEAVTALAGTDSPQGALALARAAGDETLPPELRDAALAGLSEHQERFGAIAARAVSPTLAQRLFMGVIHE
jgi:aminopeptidase N